MCTQHSLHPDRETSRFAGALRNIGGRFVGLRPKLALIVEDDTLMREAQCERLRAEHMDVIGCASAEAGEQLIAKAGPEFAVLVADVSLAGHRSGLELVESARRRLPRLRIIVVSGEEGLLLPPDVIFL
jgi:DNA-binding NtrC family response regulator